MTIARILDTKGRDVTSVGPDETVGQVVRLLAERRIGAVPVIADGAVLGVFSERDVIHGLARDGAQLLDRTVGDVMTRPAVTVGPEIEAIGALSLMTRRRIRHLPVVEGERVIGLVSIGDLVKMRVDAIEAEAHAMLDYIRGA